MTKLFNITNFASMLTWIIKWWLLICLGVNVAYAENTLQDISFTALPGNKVQLRLTLATTATTPNTFSTDSPPRLVLDFLDTKLALPSKTIMIGIGAVRSVNAIEAEGRCRVVFNFFRKVTYDIKLHANTVLLNMDNGLNVAAQKTLTPIVTVDTPKEVLPSSEPQIHTPKAPPPAITVPPVSPVNEPTAPIAPPINLESPETETPVPAPVITKRPMQTSATKSELQNIDFQRGVNGEGQILITLDNPNTPISTTEQGRDVIVEILNTKLPKSLHQKLNVTDFATPVQTIISESKKDTIQIKIRASGEYEYSTYQVDKIYTVSFIYLTPEMIAKANAKKEKDYSNCDKLSLDFQDIPIRNALHILLGEFAERNVVISDEIVGNITIHLKNVPWCLALDIILKTKGLSKREQADVIYIGKTETLLQQELNQIIAEVDIQLYKSKSIELIPTQIEVFKINYLDVKTLGDTITGIIQAREDSNKQEEEIKRINAKNSQLNNKSSNTQEQKLSEKKADSLVIVNVDSNTILVRDTPDNLDEIRNIIAMLDIPPQQVLIESRIVIADNNFSKELGVRFGWSGARNIGGGHEVNIGGGLEGHTTGTGTVNHGTWLADINGNPFSAGFEEGGVENLMVNLPTSGPSGAVDFLIGKIGSYLLQLELSAMQLENRGEVISSPRVVASNHKEAIINQGVDVPYTVTGENGPETAFKTIELKLTVTPHIVSDSSNIILELEVKKDTPVIFGDDVGADIRSVITKVMVGNGETVSLGGIYEQTKGTNKKSVPLFGDIPVFGNLFKSTGFQDSQRELLIFVTPKILQAEAMKTAK